MRYTNTSADKILQYIVELDHRYIFELINNAESHELLRELAINAPIVDQPLLLQESSERISLVTIPNEVLTHIFSFNDPVDHCRIRRACREWRDLPLDGYTAAANGYEMANAGYEMANAEHEAVNIYQMGESIMSQKGNERIMTLKTNGKLNGAQITAINGEVAILHNYKMGQKYGFSKSWDVDKKRILREVIYRNLTEKYIVDYDSNGQINEFAYYKDCFRKSVRWNKCGEIKEIMVIGSRLSDNERFATMSPLEYLKITWPSKIMIEAVLIADERNRIAHLNCRQ